MRKVSRRDGMKLVAGLTVGARVLITNEISADESLKPAQVPVDKLLELALQSPSSFMFAESLSHKWHYAASGRG